MKIAILSFSFLTPEHLEILEKLGEVTQYRSTNNEKDAIERLRGVEVAVADCWDVPLNKNVLSAIKDTRYISLNSTGFNQVDIGAAKQGGVMIANVPGFSTDSVAEQAIALMFATVRHIPAGNRVMHEKPFQIDPTNRSHDIYLGTNLRGKTLGIIGLGQIGSRVAQLGLGLGMRVIAHNRSPKEMQGVQMVDLDTLFKTSDVVSINAAYEDTLKNLVDESALSQMKPTAVLINTARGEFIDEQALAKALQEKRIAAFGADVLADWSPNNPLLKSDNVVLTPHSGFFTSESLTNMANIIVANVESYVAGKPTNLVK